MVTLPSECGQREQTNGTFHLTLDFFAHGKLEGCR